MKLTRDSSLKLGRILRERAADDALSYSEIGRRADVHMSQVSRICRGKFRTLSQNVLQICRALDVDPKAVDAAALRKIDINAPGLGSDAGQRLVHELVSLWDKTPEDAERIIRLIRDLRDFRKTAASAGSSPRKPREAGPA